MTILLLLCLLLGDGPTTAKRTIHDNVITSDKNPAIKIKVDDKLTYVGSFPFDIKHVAGGERHVWVQADKDKRITRLFTLQFEGYYDNVTYSYNYKPRNVVHLGENDYNSNGFFYDDSTYEKEHPGNEATGMRKFLEAKGYKLDYEQGLFRFYRSLPDDNKNEFLIFYIEPMKEMGISMKDTSENQQMDHEKELIAALRERALKTFTIIEH
jgi:hypothetical protein